MQYTIVFNKNVDFFYLKKICLFKKRIAVDFSSTSQNVVNIKGKKNV